VRSIKESFKDALGDRCSTPLAADQPHQDPFASSQLVIHLSIYVHGAIIIINIIIDED